MALPFTERSAQRRRNRAAVLPFGTEGANWCALLRVLTTGAHLNKETHTKKA
jgi:hypothetical protein